MNIIDIPNGAHGPHRAKVEGVVLHAIGEWVVDNSNLAEGGRGRIYHCTDWLRAIGRSCHVFALPDGRGVLSLEAQNLLDQRVRFQDRTLRRDILQVPRFAPELTVVAKATLRF